MPNSLLKLMLAKENSLFYHYSLMKYLASCSLEEYRYFAKLDYQLNKLK